MTTIRFRGPPKRLLAAVVLCVASLLASVNSAAAGPLAPGTAIANDGAPVIAPFGVVMADTGYVAYTQTSILGVSGTGFVREMVVAGDGSNPLGGLTFVYQVIVTSGTVDRVTVANYNPYLTDASAAAYIGANVLPGAPWAATTANGAVDATATAIDRDIIFGTVGFNYSLLTGAGVSDLMVIRTNATAYTLGSISLIDGGVASVAGFAPTPEPTSMALLGIGLAGMCGYRLRRRHPKSEPQE